MRGLNRAERIALFRADTDTSKFPSSWIRFEAERGHPLAQALLGAVSLGIDLPAIEQLYRFGEPEAAEHLIRKVAVDGSSAVRTTLMSWLPAESELLPYLRGFQLAGSGMTTGKTAMQAIMTANRAANRDNNFNFAEIEPNAASQTALRYVDLGYQAGAQAIDNTLEGPLYDAITNWTLRAPAASGLAGLCRLHCAADEIRACAITGFGLIGGYYEIIRFDSPLESVISQSRFAHSQRARNMTARRIASARTEAGVPVFSPSQLRDKSRCLAETLP